MPRPKRPRYIQSHPDIQGFTPDGISHNGETVLSIEEFEAIRLSDYMGLDQSRAAEQMNVSRQTFGRILKQARYNLSEALVTGKRLKVTGGCYQMQGRGRRRRGGCNKNIEEENIMENQKKDNSRDSGAATGRGQGGGQGQGQGKRGQGKGQGQGKRCQGQGCQGRGQSGGCRRGNR
ncbi:DUF134 domain-containing protein [Desulfobacula phenolica]|uniref:UPF0251 protein SAMN04487931_11351 n=1 Tax=Desulfobacula phenolica TaxID=90732 RepID=A0A1H2JLC3_9BACT|nr:DUF134 domain-containing protein [Desulfobacula phenolica]SDU56936.1 Predicted DNA-binding protein, UPF0251 family [Desulfobacula phenolica]